MRLFPTWSWLITPSGGPVKPGTLWWRTIYDSPIIAHPLGAWGVVGFMALGDASGFLLWWPVLLAEGINQWHKAIRGVYGTHLAENVIWRMVLAAVAAAPAILL
jgi:hypothetical protein